MMMIAKHHIIFVNFDVKQTNETSGNPYWIEADSSSHKLYFEAGVTGGSLTPSFLEQNVASVVVDSNNANGTFYVNGTPTYHESGDITPGNYTAAYRTSGGQTHTTVSYHYAINTEFYDTLVQNTNVVALGGFVFTKTGLDDENQTAYLAGAVYQLFVRDIQGSLVRYPNANKTFTTDSDGKIEFSEMLVGNYQLVETKAPKGYLLDSTPIDFVVTASFPTLTTSVTGGYSSINNVTNDSSTYAPDWDATYSSTTNIELITNDSQTINAGSGSYSGVEKFIKNSGVHITGLIDQLDDADYKVFDKTDAIVVKMAGDKVEKFSNLEEAKDYINDLIDGGDVTGELAITGTAYYASTDNTTYTQVIQVNERIPTPPPATGDNMPLSWWFIGFVVLLEAAALWSFVKNN